jgi:hypothetical protein
MASTLSIQLHPILKRVGKQICRRMEVECVLPRSIAAAELTAAIGKTQPLCTAIEGSSGRSRTTIWLPEPERAGVVYVELKSSGKVLAQAKATIAPCRRWRIDLLHHSHFDLGYTSLQPEILSLQMANIDTALDYITRFKNQPEEGRFRWNVECTFPLMKYLESRPDSCRQRLVQADHDGLLEVAAMPFTLQSEGCSTEELLRSLYPVKRLREMGFAIRTAVQSDVPGASALLPRILNDIGVRHLAMAPNNYRAPFHETARESLPRPFLWQGPCGGELMTWFTDLYDHVYQEGNILGFLENLGAVEERIGPRLAELEGSGFPWRTLGLRIQGSYSDNGRPNLRIAEIVQAWNERYLAPQIRMSTFHQFFVGLEKETNGRLKKIRAFWPDWWNEGIGSMAREFAMHRRSQEKAQFSQTALALASGTTPSQMRLLDDTWQNLLLCDEHTWGAAVPSDDAEIGPNSGKLQTDFKKSFFFQGSLLSAQAENAASAIWAMTGQPCEGPSLTVQNALSWKRGGLVEIPRDELELLTPGAKSWKFSDRQTHRALVSQQITRGGVSTVQIFVEDVPAFGQSFIFVEALDAGEPDREVPLQQGRDVHRGVLSNARSIVECCSATGGILRWTKRDTGVVLANDDGPFLLGSLLHQTFARRHEFFIRQEITGFSREEGSRIEKLEEGPLFSRLVTCAKCGPMTIRREVVLHHTMSRIDVRTTLQKPPTNDPEAVFMALPMEVSKGRCILGTNGGPMIPGQDQIPGSSSDWFVLREHLDVAGPSGGVMVALPDTPQIQLGDICRPSVRGTGRIPRELFVYVLNNLWPTNFAPAQGGEFTFRASLIEYSHAYDAAWSLRRALECNSPLRGYLSAASSAGTGKSNNVPLQVDTTDNVIASLHPTEGGFGAHVREIGGAAGYIRMTFSGSSARRVVATNVAGEILREISVRKKSVKLLLKANEILSLQIFTLDAGSASKKSFPAGPSSETQTTIVSRADSNKTSQ